MISPELLKKVRQIQIRTGRLVSDVFAGQYHSAFKGQGMEFHEVREYLPGDDIRAIDWNVTARMGHPYIKKFIEEREMTVMLMVDISASQRFGGTARLKKELAAELAAVLAFSAIENNDRAGLLLFSDDVELYIPPAKGVRHVLRLIRELLYFEPRGRTTRIQPALEFLNHISHRKTVTFLVSDFHFHEPYRHLLTVAAKRHDLIGVLIGDRLEQTWPASGLVMWEDSETGERRLVDSSSRTVRARLAADWQSRRDRLLSELRRAGVDPVEVFTGEAYEKELARFFKTRKKRLGRV